MEYSYIKYLKDNNPSIRLLRLENSPLIIGFLHKTFKNRNVTYLPRNEIISELSDYLYNLNQPEKIYPLSANEYLQKWSNDGYVRIWYETDNDEPFFELTPATEKVFDLILDLEKKDFVGTESRLKNIFSMLKEISYKNTEDTDKRIEELEKEKARIEFEIAKVKSGHLEKLSETKTKELFIQAEETARKLLSDFKQVEQNFRELDADIRRKQLNTKLPKGKVLDDIFVVHDLIWSSDQGQSFKAFWEFLMSQEKQDELNDMIDIVLNLPELDDIKKDKDNVLERLKFNLINAGDKVHKTNHQIIEQLRRFLSSNVFLENKRLLEIINSIEEKAIQIKDNVPTERSFIEIEDKIKLDFVMLKPLFTPPKLPEIADLDIEIGTAEEISTNILYQQLYINIEELKENIQNILKFKDKVTLKEILEKYPIEKGLMELISYFSIATKDENAIINDELYENIVIYNNETDKYSEIKLPQTIFCK